ncbi:acyl-CoA dehydrogenase [Streptomyces chilikensis]|uniref:Acyl-CoA dehydrogenase n=1 Tax=Streptomyces chilikensis TaxID=1194079 RepID=A0ABV3EVL1_9ACTN
MGDLPPVLDARRDAADGAVAALRRPPSGPSCGPPRTARAQERATSPDRLPADTDGTRPPAGEPLLGKDVTAEFVPAEEGGRLVRHDLLAAALRPLFRHDAGLALVHAVTSLSAASAVWTAGTPGQRRRLADRLLDGGRLALVPPETGRRNTPWQGGVRARRSARAYVLNGGTDLAVGPAGAGSCLVYARTAQGDVPHSHTALLLDTGHPSGPARPPYRAAGRPRTTPHAAPWAKDRPVPLDARVGEEGDGVPLALRTLPFGRLLVCDGLTAAAGTVLGEAVRTATQNRAGPPRNEHHARALAGFFADLLACAALTGAALRATSLLPRQAALPAAAAGCLVPEVLRDGLEDLSTVLGPVDHPRPGSAPAGYARLSRLLPAALAGPDGLALCRAVVIPWLSGAATGPAVPEPDGRLFAVRAKLPPADLRQLGAGGGDDVLGAALEASAGRLDGARRLGGTVALLAELAQAFLTELRLLRERLPRATAAPGPAGEHARRVLGDRYAVTAAAAAVLGTWESQDGGDPFLADPSWAALALSRLLVRIGRPAAGAQADPSGPLGAVLAELTARRHTGRSYDIDGLVPREG